jgi:hypothetical protein
MANLSDALVGFGQAVRARFRTPFNTQNQLLTGGEQGFAARPTALTVGFVQTDEELAFQQEQEESFGTVFNEWTRISRMTAERDTLHANGDSNSDAALPSELNAWDFNPTTERITCTINSETLLGFISNERYNNYTLEVRLNSNNSDDDFIGLCIAHAQDSSGKTHILTAIRGYNARAPLVIDKNYWAHTADNWIDNPSEYEVARVYSGLQWADGTTTTTPIANGSRGGWNAVSNGVLLKITREDDLITVETSLNNGTSYHEPAKRVIDLSMDPELEVFRGPQRYGYVCHSQNASTFDVLDRVTERHPIVDTRNYRLYVFEGGNWVVKSDGLPALIASGVLVPNQLHMNPITGRFYYMRGEESLDLITAPSE